MYQDFFFCNFLLFKIFLFNSLKKTQIKKMEVCFLNWFELNISSILGKSSPPVLVLPLFSPLAYALSLSPSCLRTHSLSHSHKCAFVRRDSLRNAQELFRRQVLRSSFGIFNQNTILCLCWSTGNQFQLVSGGFGF